MLTKYNVYKQKKAAISADVVKETQSVDDDFKLYEHGYT